jgi:hypothetical protein
MRRLGIEVMKFFKGPLYGYRGTPDDLNAHEATSAFSGLCGAHVAKHAFNLITVKA